ncbi:hypothetical protein B0H17DRAFT_1215383 [Mycena rosella]|uniref:Uncharacterized protein n=1 Tax=Mycena rosella TaxID=1033263 RepID=A0AAD7CHQ9_MYCRO|nr:hypothetical protein B0H17DRAFT_1215383 [Mycena rosella]
MIVSVPKYLRHLISQHMTLDGNSKADLFFKRDDGSDTALTDGNMYFPVQKEFERIAKAYVIPEEDKEVPCKVHIGSIWHQGQGKYGNVAISGVIGSACDHAVLAAFIDMLISEAVLAIALLNNHRQHPLQETWDTITKLRDSLNVNLKKFRERQRAICPCLKLSALDADKPELTAIQLPSYRMKHGQRTTADGDANNFDSQLREAEIKLWCSEADSGILAVRRKGTWYLRLFDGTAWYLQSGGTLPGAAVPSPLSPIKRRPDNEAEPQLLSGTQTLKRVGGLVKSPRTSKRLKDIVPDDVVVDCPSLSEAEDSDLEMSPSKRAKLRPQRAGKKKGKKGDGWIWLENVMRGQALGEGKLAEYKRESDRVQWFRADVSSKDREQTQSGGLNGAVSITRMQAAMYQRLQHNAGVVFKSPESGAHHNWVSATTFDELVIKIDTWRDGVFKWMDDMGIYRAYKDF